MKTILVPLDGSTLAEQVLPYVRLLAEISRAQIRLIRVIEAVDRDQAMNDMLLSLYGAGESPTRAHARLEELWRQMRESAEGYLASHVALLRGVGLEASADIYVGSPAEMIVDIAAQAPATLIAMATHGYSGLKRWAMGSTADKVVHAATTPVFVVRGRSQPLAEAPRLRRVLVPQDGSAFARQALPLASELAVTTGAEVVLLEAIERTNLLEPSRLGRPRSELEEMFRELQPRVRAELEMLVTGLHTEGVTARAIVQIGDAADVIVELAEREQVDLVIMATHGYSGIKRWALGSVADKVLHASTAPLILICPQDG
jgi:nucleotide-binding universal stress UspA family protein